MSKVEATIGRVWDFEPTARGYRCVACFDRNVAWFQVQELRTNVKSSDENLSNFWFILSSVAVFYPAARSEAQRVVEHHVALYDPNLSSTLSGFWDAWTQAGPVAEGETSPAGNPVMSN